MRSNVKVTARQVALVEQLETRRMLSAAVHAALFKAAHAQTARADVADSQAVKHPKGRRLAAARAAAASASPAVSAAVAAAPASGLIDSVYHGDSAYTSANRPSPNPNTGLTDSTVGGDNAALTRVVSWAAAHTPNYTFTNVGDAFVYTGGSATGTGAFLGADASGAALTDPANVNDTIFDAEGYFQTPTANDVGKYTVSIGGVDDVAAVYVGGNGTPGSGTLVASAGWQGANAGLSGFQITLPAGTSTSSPASIPVEIIYANGFGGANLNAVSGSSPAVGVRVTDPAGVQVTSFQTTASNEPRAGAPTLTDVPGNNAVQLNWNAQNFASSYSVYRYNGGASPTTAVKLVGGVTGATYTDSTALNNHSYSYYVTADNVSGSTASNTLTVSLVPMVTGPVTAVSAVRASATAVQISFNAPNLGTNYTITRSTSPGGTQTTLTPAGGQTATTFTDTSAPTTGNVDYYYTITSVNGAGSSPAVTVFAGHGEGWAAAYYTSNQVDGNSTGNSKPLSGDDTTAVLAFERIDATITAPPANTPAGFNNIQPIATNDYAVRWTGYVEAPITGYYSFGVSNVDDREQVTVYDPTHLTNGQPTPVNISPAGHTMAGYGDTYTVPVVGTTGQPYAFTAGQKYLVQVDYNQGYGGLNANLSWAASSTAANATAATPTYDTIALTTVPTYDVATPVPSFTPVDASGTVAKDQSYYAFTPTANNHVVVLSWNNVAADSYNLYRATSQSGPYTLLTSVAAKADYSALSYTDTGLTNGTTYYYVVTGVNGTGETPITLSTGATPGLTASATPNPTAPAAPTNVVAIATNSTTAGLQGHVSFPAVPFTDTYIVQRAPETPARSGTAGAFVTVPGGGAVTGSGSTISFTDSDPTLKSNLNYFYRVIAVSGGLQSPASAATEMTASGPALAAEGTVEVDVRASGYASGSVSSIANVGAQGGAFTAVGGAITVGPATDDNNTTYQAFQFNGANAATSTFNAPSDLTGNSSRSIELWVDNPALNSGEETVVSWSHRGGPDGSNMAFSYGSQYAVGLWGSEYDETWASTAPGVTGTGAPAANSWHYLVFTYDGTNDDVYVDGQLYLQRPVANAGLATVAGLPVNLAAQNSAGSSGFSAASLASLNLASVRIESGALTAADVANNYNAGVVPGRAPPLGVVALTSGSTVSVTWAAGATAASYNVYRATTLGGEGATPIATSITTNHYTDTSVVAGQQYYYQITAVDPTGLESDRSFEVAARASLPSSVIITEFQAVNDGTLQDAAGDDPDWVELYNPTGASVNLSGYYLTDKATNLTEWQIPSVTLASGSFLVIFCDGTNQLNPAELHTNFSIGSSGGYVGLVAPNGTTVLSSYAYSTQLRDLTYGTAMTKTVAGGTLITSYGATGYLNPTPGAPNGQLKGLGITAQPTFDHADGFYTTSFPLVISDATPGAVIYYTLDGSLPSATNGTRYTGPITITGQTDVRALAVGANYLPSFTTADTFIYTSQVVTQDADGSPPPGWPSSWGNSGVHYGMDPRVVNDSAYSAEIQQDLKSLPTFSLTMSLSDLFDPTSGIYSNPSQTGDAWTRAGNVEYILPDGTVGFTTEAGIAIKGDASNGGGNAKHGFRIEFGDYGQKALTYPLFGTSGAQSFEEFDLRTDQNFSWQHETPSQFIGIRDEFSDQTLAALANPAQRTKLAFLYINGVFWGLYDAVDRPDANWAANTFGGDSANYDVIKSGGVQNGFTIESTDGTLSNWDTLFNDMKTLDFSNNANYEMIQGNNPDGTRNPAYANLIDVKNLAQYILMIDYVGDMDGPNSGVVGPNQVNNFYAVRPTDGSFGFRFLAVDSEFTLNDVNTNRVNSDTANVTESISNPMYFFQQLETNPAFKRLVADDIQADFFNNGPMTPAASNARFTALASQISGGVVEESARWGDVLRPSQPYTRNVEWQAEINRIETSYLPQRTGIVLNQLSAVGLVPTVAAPTFSQYGGNVAAGYALTISKVNSGDAIYYTLDGSDPVALDGTRSSTAVLYTGAIPLNTTTEVKARILSGGTWSALTDATFNVPITGLRVTELNYDPSPPGGGYTSDDDEFIELKNFGTTAINLSGASFTHGITYTFGSVALAPGQVGVLVANPDAFAARYGTGITILGTYGSGGTSFNNTGEEVTLVDATGQTLTDFTYSAAWASSTAGTGPSLEVVNPASNPDLNQPASWRASPQAGGTPGVDDSIPTAAPTNLTVATSGAQVVLNWSAVAGAASYNVYRGTAHGGESTTPIATGVTSTTFTDASAVSGNTYYYTVAAVDPGGVSAVSNEASIVLSLPPSAPQVTQQPVSQLVKVGGTATFTAAAAGNPTPSVQWKVSTDRGVTWTAIAGATSTTLTVAVTSPVLDGREYEAVFTNTQGSTASTPATLTAIAATATAWNFDTSAKTGTAIAVKSNVSPDPSKGTGVASTLGMALVSGPDKSDVLVDAGSTDAGASNQAWRIVGNNGWSSTAPIASQGAQFLVSTVGLANVSLQFDWNDTAQGEGNLAVQYTTDGGATWQLAPSLNANGDAGISVVTNSASNNTVKGQYFAATGGALWYNRLTADFNGVAGVANNANFGVRLVNASTGADNVNSTGQPLNNTSGNWRFDEVDVGGMSALPANVTPSADAVYTYDAGTGTLNVTAGTMTFTADTTSGTLMNVAATGANTNLLFATTQHLAGLALHGGATAAISGAAGGTLTVAGLLTIDQGVGGGLDLGNGQLALTGGATPLSAVRSYVLAACDNGLWDGTGGITSAAVKADAAHKGIAYVTGANTASSSLNPVLADPTAILIRPALLGDWNLDGVVDRFDVRQFNARNAFNDGLTTHDWSDGDLNFDGKIDRFDVRSFNAGNNFNNGVTYQPGT